jgi:type VII secretion-associated serine protease mycosin
VGATGPAGRAAEVTPAGPPAPHDPAARSWDRVDRSVGAAPATVAAKASPRGVTRVVAMRSIGGRPTVEVRTVRGRAAATQAVAAAQERPGVLSVELDTRVRTMATPSSDDPYRSDQWGLDRLKAEDVWARRSGAGVTVAVVDTGVEAGHPDLAGVVLPGTDLVTGTGDGGADGNGHGTHVAGIVGAVANNRLGVAGLAQGVKILPVRVLDDTGAGFASAMAEGIVYAVDHGASVINMSLGTPTASTATANAVRYAIGKNVTVVAAAGNSALDGNPVSYPAAYPDVIGVGASDAADQIASFSNHGSYVDLAAPGVDIVSTYRLGAYAFASGTSMASPYVAAAAALLKAVDPARTPAQIAVALQTTATDLGGAGRDNYFGYGLIDPSAALAAVPCDVTACGGATTVTEVLGRSATLRYGATVTGTARVRDGGTGLAGVPAQLCTKVAPSAGYRCRDYTTDAKGYVGYRLAPRATTRVYVRYPGTAGTKASQSALIAYTVVPGITVKKLNRTITASVAMDSRRSVVLERRVGTRWVTSRTAVLYPRKSGTFTKLTPGRYRLRVAASATLGAAVSGAVRIV